MYCIYKARNTINDKVYIGKTNNFPKRKREHFFDKRQDHLFSRALRKYGEECFEWSIIEDNIETLDVANEREKYWIAHYNSYFRSQGSNGYNMTRGGDGGSQWNVKRVAVYSLDGTFEKAFESVTECTKYLGITGTTQVSKVCDKRDRTCAGKLIVSYIDIPPEQVEPFHRINSRNVSVCRINPTTKEVVQYASIKDAGKEGFNRTGIVGCAKGVYKNSGGYIWCYSKDINKAITRTIDAIQAYGKEKRIVQKNHNGEVIAKYNNCAEAARSVGASSNKIIHKALTIETHYSNGYYWYKE